MAPAASSPAPALAEGEGGADVARQWVFLYGHDMGLGRAFLPRMGHKVDKTRRGRRTQSWQAAATRTAAW